MRDGMVEELPCFVGLAVGQSRDEARARTDVTGLSHALEEIGIDVTGNPKFNLRP